ncbi:type II membrane protein, partial [Cryomyces antarcticus]
DSTDEGGEGRRKREEGEDGKAEDGGKEGEKQKDPDEGKSLRFVSYKPEGDHGVGTLRLEWHTKYACESQKDVDDSPPSGKTPSSSSHWGFFTWFLIIAFLAIAAYLIFASWLNYNRYGARGWDLLPHGDALRDVPYLLRDWARRVATTVQGGRSRGGYAAV